MEIFSYDIRIHVDYYYAYTLLIRIPSNNRVKLFIISSYWKLLYKIHTNIV